MGWWGRGARVGSSADKPRGPAEASNKARPGPPGADVLTVSGSLEGKMDTKSDVQILWEIYWPLKILPRPSPIQRDEFPSKDSFRQPQWETFN